MCYNGPTCQCIHFWGSSSLSVGSVYLWNPTTLQLRNTLHRLSWFRTSCPVWWNSPQWSQLTACSEKKKITRANKRLFRILKVGPDGGSVGGGCFPIHRSSVFLCPTAEGLVISCTVISYFIFTLTATWLQPEPDAKPITPEGAGGTGQAGNQCGRCTRLSRTLTVKHSR